jgi:hypothetical protein
LEIFEECLENITNRNLSKKSIMENYQSVALIIDEMIDEGVVINTDVDAIEAKVLFREPSKINIEAATSTAGGYFRGLFSNAKSYLAKTGINS